MKIVSPLLSVPLAVLLAVALQAQEPLKTTFNPASSAAQAQINASDTLLSQAAEHFAYVDVSSSLMAANGLGIDVAAVEPALRAQLGLEENTGLVVTAVPEESNGAKAGLKVHDVVVQLQEEIVRDSAKLVDLLDASDGKRIKLRILRGGKAIELEATPKKPEVAHLRITNLINQNLTQQLLVQEERYRIGVTLSEADETLRTHLRLAAGEGLVVTEVFPDSAAASAGIAQHDVLIVLDGKRLTTVEAINAQIQEIKDKSVELRLLRSGKEMALQIAARKTVEAAFTDQPITYWDVKNCQRCHANPWQSDAHAHLGLRLGANQSVWTDGHTAKWYHYWHPQTGEKQEVPAGGNAAPQEQIGALKSQLAEMQKTIAALEASLATSEPKGDESKPEGKPEEKKE